MEKVASKLLAPVRCQDQGPSSMTADITDNCEGVTKRKCDVTTSCCDVTKSQLIAEVREYMSANNPSAMWRTEREKKLLEAGLQSLRKGEREALRKDRILYKMDN